MRGSETTIQEAVAFAEKVLGAKKGEVVGVMHKHNYFSRPRSLPKNRENKNQNNSQVIYTTPGKARELELRLPPPDPRKGKYPQHNTPGPFRKNIEVLPSLKLTDYEHLHTVMCLEQDGFNKQVLSLTKKHLELLAHQFANLSPRCFKDMLCLFDSQKRDYEVYVKSIQEEDSRLVYVAMVNPNLNLIQFIQCLRYDDQAKLVDLRHVVFEAGIAIVMNQSCYDVYGHFRNIAHVGVTGANANSYHNSLERFDDGTVLWTSSDYSEGSLVTGSAALKDSGQVILLNEGIISEAAARNLGAEGINSHTLAWTGKFSPDACLAEVDDKYIVRREYKTAVRKQVNQIVDGACIPGLMPVFKPRMEQN